MGPTKLMNSLSLNSSSDSMTLSVPKLHDDGSNWSDYQSRIERVMGSKGLWRHVLGTAVAPKPFVLLNGIPVCKGMLISAFFTDGISLPHDSGHILSMQHPVCPTTSSVKQPTPCLSLPWWLVRLWDGSVTGTRKRTPNISKPYSVICHCCSYHHCCANTIIIPSIVLSCI